MSYLYGEDEISIITRHVNDAFKKANERMSQIEEILNTLTKKIEKLEQQQREAQNGKD